MKNIFESVEDYIKPTREYSYEEYNKILKEEYLDRNEEFKQLLKEYIENNLIDETTITKIGIIYTYALQTYYDSRALNAPYVVRYVVFKFKDGEEIEESNYFKKFFRVFQKNLGRIRYDCLGPVCQQVDWFNSIPVYLSSSEEFTGGRFKWHSNDEKFE